MREGRNTDDTRAERVRQQVLVAVAWKVEFSDPRNVRAASPRRLSPCRVEKTDLRRTSIVPGILTVPPNQIPAEWSSEIGAVA